MKQLPTRVFSLLLTLALLLSLSAPALAANTVEPSLVTLDKTAATVYLHDGAPIPVRLTATVQPSDFDGSLTWSVPAGARVTVAASDKTGASVSAEAGAAAGESAVVTATATTGTVSRSATCTVTLKADAVKSKTFGPFTVEAGKTAQALPTVTWESGVTDSAASGYYVDDPTVATVDSQGNVKALAKGATKLHATVGGETLTAALTVVGVEGITLDRSTLKLSVGDAAVALTATVKPAGLNYTPTFTTSDASVAAVSADGKVTAKKPGAATITAKITDSSGTEYSAACTVSVSALSGDVSDSTDAGADLSFKKIYAAIADRYAKAGGSGNPTIAFSSVGSSAIGTLYETSAKAKTVDSSYYGSLSLLENMCFVPAAAGRYIITYTVSSSGRTAVLSGTITVEVTNAVKNIHIGLPSNADYLFSEAASGGSTGVRLISDALGAYGSIRFGAVASGSGTGTLYTAQSGSIVRSGTIVNSGDVGALYFSASRSAAFQIAYSAYSGANATGSLVASGTLTLGAGADSLNVTVYLDEVGAYRFSASTRRSSASAASLLRAAVNANTGSAAWKYVRFDDAASVNTCSGTLYTDTAALYAVNANTYIAESDLDNLYFVPTQSGSFEVGYGVYADAAGSAPLASGKLRITASSLAADTAALYFNTTPGATLALRDSDFESWYTGQKSGAYHLEYVLFNSISRSFGTLYDGGTRLAASNTRSYYTADYYNAKDSNGSYLSGVTFTAPSYAGYLEVAFTCYGRSGAKNALSSASGVLRIYVTAGSVADVVCPFNGTAPVAIKESELTAVYRAATASSAAAPVFYIQLMEVPAAGTLYEDYNRSTGRGTALTDKTVDLVPYYVNGGGADSVSTLAYVPNNRSTGSYDVRYIAFSADGTELYAGKLVFRYDADANTVNVTDGYTFRAADVTDDAGALYVVFEQPALGKLYLDYKNGSGTVLPANTRLYLTSAANGVHPVSALTYIPRSDINGNAEVKYTVYTASRSYSGTLLLKSEKKTASKTFSDVVAGKEGDWAANAIDFASKWGLVNGTGGGKFSPSATMRRCDLVLILYRNAGSPAVSGTLAYTDVPATAYYRDSALWAAQNNIMAGVVTGTKYDPDAAITRQDFTRILYNYAAHTGASLTGAVSLSAYKDAGMLAAYAKDAMAWAVGKGYINGTSTTTLSPTDKATRAQIATLLHRYLTL